MSDEKKSVWGYILSVVGGFVLGVLAFVGIRRSGVSDGTGERIDSVGKHVDEVVDGVAGAEERNKEAVGTVVELADTVGGISDGADSLEEGITDARKSVGRLKELIRAERERLEKAHSKE